MTNTELKNFMEFSGMTNEDLCQALGVGEGAVRHWLSGARSIPEPVARVIMLFIADAKFIDWFKSLGGDE